MIPSRKKTKWVTGFAEGPAKKTEKVSPIKASAKSRRRSFMMRFWRWFLGLFYNRYHREILAGVPHLSEVRKVLYAWECADRVLHVYQEAYATSALPAEAPSEALGFVRL